MRISSRAADIAPFYAMEFSRYASALEAEGHHVVRLNLGEPDFGAPPAVLAALREVTDGRPLPYTSALGISELRNAIAGFYGTRHGVDIAPERVVVTAGASAALMLAASLLVEPGSRALVADPSYPCNRHFLTAFGAEVDLVPTGPDTRFQLDTALVREHWTPATTGVLMASPANPTGTSIPTDELRGICEYVAAQDGWRIVDEIYLDLSDPTETAGTPPTALSFDPGVIVVNSFSKYFGMTGWRLGWLVVPEHLVTPLEKLSQNYYICPSTPAQYAALACFTGESLALAEARRAEFLARRTFVTDALDRIGLPVPVRPDGAFYSYVDVTSTGLDSWTFCERVLREAHVALTPGRDFGVLTADTHVRVSCAASLDELAEGMTRLESFLQSL